MSEWKKVRLGDVVSIKSGLSYKSEFIGKGDNLLLGMGCVSYKEQFLDSGVRPYSQDCDLKYMAAPGDLVLATRQQSDNLPILAMPAIIPEKYRGRKIIIGTNLYRVENQSDIDNRFLFFVLKGLDYVNYIRGVKTGTTVQMVSKRNVEEYCFLCPPKETREQIVSILSRYDTLIENYQRQIKLLEEAAQRLYKEWFVDLRFPGYENTKIVDGVPEGWGPSKLGDLAEFRRGKTITKKEIIEGSVPVVAGGITPAYYCNKSNTENRVITISASGKAGFVKMYFEKIWASDCSFLDVSDTTFLHFIFCYLKQNQISIYNMQKGSAQQHVYAKDINAMDLLRPTEELLNCFEKIISKDFDKISALQSQIRLLTEARDRFLPKLMSGEITV